MKVAMKQAVHLSLLCVIGCLHGMAIPNDESNLIHHGRKLLGTTTEDPVTTQAPSTSETKTFWEKIEEFYEDKNNFAMYLVLPCIVLVYGGCVMIYCVAKCRQYFKRKKDKKDTKRLQDDVDDDMSDNEMTQNNNNNDRKMSFVSDGRQTRNNNAVKAASLSAAQLDRPYSKASVSDVKMEQRETPLPWQVPDESDSYPTKHPPPRPPPPSSRVMSGTPDSGKTKHRPSSEYPDKTNRLPTPDEYPRKVPPRPQPVPHHENPRRPEHHRGNQEMMSPPPPYESHQHHAGASVFTVDYGKDKYSDDIPRKVPARPMYNPNPKVKVISNIRGGAPVSDLESQAMARHAAQLLRLDDKPGPGMPGYKKPKRLVFVAE